MTKDPLSPEKPKKKPGVHQVLLPVVVVLGISWVALSLMRWQGEKVENHSHGESPASGRPTVGQVLQDFDLLTVDGKSKSVSSVISSTQAKVLLINVWATWCGPCISEMPSIVKLREKYHSEGFEVLGINVDEDPAEILHPFEKKLGMKFESFIDREGRFSDRFGTSSIPFSVVINQNRKILLVELGDRDWFSQEMQKKTEVWLKGKEQ